MVRCYLTALLLVLETSCAPNSHSGSEPGPKRAATDLQPAIATPIPVAAQPSASASCRVRATVTANLDENPGTETVVWRRCGPEQAIETDGHFEYPIDRVVVSSGGLEHVLYDNAPSPQACGMSSIATLGFDAPAEQMLVVSYCYGSGNIRNFEVFDLRHHAVRTWKSPNLDAALEPSVKADERLGKQVGPGPTAHDGSIAVEFLVYGPGDPLCCSSRDNIRAHLVGTNGILKVANVSRVHSGDQDSDVKP